MATATAEPEAQTEVAPEPRRWTVSVDFDGVLHSYTTPWIDATTIPDPPVPGAIDWLNAIGADYDIVIHTTRAASPGGADAVEAYLREHGCRCEVRATAIKPPALIYVDDRGWRFRGRFPTTGQIRGIRPWKVGDPQPSTARDKIKAANARLNELEAKQHQLKQDRNRLRELLLEEVLAGRGFDDPAIAVWLDERDAEPFDAKIAAARAEPVR